MLDRHARFETVLADLAVGLRVIAIAHALRSGKADVEPAGTCSHAVLALAGHARVFTDERFRRLGDDGHTGCDTDAGAAADGNAADDQIELRFIDRLHQHTAKGANVGQARIGDAVERIVTDEGASLHVEDEHIRRDRDRG
ncbi:hypothetical protein D9M68_186170 [compost metagenome]